MISGCSGRGRQIYPGNSDAACCPQIPQFSNFACSPLRSHFVRPSFRRSAFCSRGHLDYHNTMRFDSDAARASPQVSTVLVGERHPTDIPLRMCTSCGRVMVLPKILFFIAMSKYWCSLPSADVGSIKRTLADPGFCSMVSATR